MNRPAVPRPLRKALTALLLALTTVSGFLAETLRPVVDADTQAETPQQTGVPRRAPETPYEAAQPFGRTELFFGAAKPQGVVTEAEFQAFVDEHVTRRFPDGLTVLKGAGQFRDEHRVVRKEAAFVLIVLYPDATREKSSRKLNEIREIYKDLFQQRSVLRVDDPQSVWVSF
jgi:hypothetical protein